MEGSLEKNLNKETLKTYWRYAKRYWPLATTCVVGTLVVIICDVASPIVFKHFFDLLASANSAELRDKVLPAIYWTIGSIASIKATTFVGWRIIMWALAKFESLVMKDTTDGSFVYLQNHSAHFFANAFSGALVKRVNRFTSGLETVADQLVMNLGQTVLRIALVLGVLFWYNQTLGVIFLVWTTILITFNFYFSKYKMKFDLVKAEVDTKVTARLADTITNAINLKLFAGTNREIKEFQEVTTEHHKARFKSWMIGWAYEAVQGLSGRVMEMIMLVVAVGYWFAGQLTLGDLVMLRSYLDQLQEEIRSLGGNIRHIYEALADANEMTEILTTPHEIVDRPNAVPIHVPKGEVEFRSLQFSYNSGNRVILKDFSLKTKPGEKIGIVGPSGGGKSTLLKVLVRLYDIQGGQIIIDGQDVAMVTQDSLHQNIAYVPQDPVLFHRSLLENIRYSRPSATDEEVYEAARLAHCHEFISSFPQGYQTLVGERGIKLSGGERQRVAIARAIIMNAPILVLDEATSSLDSESELYIQDSLSRIMPGKTVIAVAHRLATIKKMDRIVVVKDGRVVEQGRHDLLLKVQDGHYQRLWGLQTTEHNTVH